MGFRSTFTTQQYNIDWPKWFIDKYAASVSCHGGLSSTCERKTYDDWAALPQDIHRAIDWENAPFQRFVVIYLHECGGVTRCQIEKDSVRWSEPDSWSETEGVDHSYCYGCSNITD